MSVFNETLCSHIKYRELCTNFFVMIFRYFKMCFLGIGSICTWEPNWISATTYKHQTLHIQVSNNFYFRKGDAWPLHGLNHTPIVVTKSLLKFQLWKSNDGRYKVQSSNGCTQSQEAPTPLKDEDTTTYRVCTAVCSLENNLSKRSHFWLVKNNIASIPS